MEIAVNFFLYAFLFLFLKKKQKGLPSLYVCSIWLFTAFLGFFYIQSDVYKEPLHSITVFPFFYLFCCFIILIYPLTSKRVQITEISTADNIVYIFSCGLIAISIIPAGEVFWNLIDMFRSGRFLLLGANYDMVATGQQQSLIQFSSFSAHFLEIIKACKCISLILFFYFLPKKSISKFVKVALLIVAFIPALVTLSIGGKTNLIYFLIYFIGLYCLLNKTLAEESRSFVYKLGLFFLSFIVVLVIALSIGRYVVGDRGGDHHFSEFLFGYAAESMFNFNGNAFYEPGDLNGLFTSLPLFQDIGLVTEKIDYRVDYLQPLMMCPAQYFYTVIGDIYLDFGAFLTPVILGIISFVANRSLINSKIKLSSLVLFSTYYYLLVNGIFYFCYCTLFTPIYANLFFYIVIRFFETRKS